MSDKYQTSLFADLSIEFKKRARQKNLRIRVRNNHVTVSGPASCHDRSMREFLNQNWTWVETVIQKQNLRSRALEETRHKYKYHVMYHGEWLPVRPSGYVPTPNWVFHLADGILWFTPPHGAKGYPDAEMINAYLKKIAKPQILARFEAFAPNLPFQYNRVFIRSQKTKWGTCSAKGNMSFNWLLVKCPYWIWDYLFVHELCHTVHFNHSKAFWDLVDAHFPRREEAEAWIKAHGDIVFRL